MYEMGHSRLEVSKGFLGLLSLLQALYKRGLLFRFTDSSSSGYPSTQKSRLLQYTELISYLLSPLSDTDLIDSFRSRILLSPLSYTQPSPLGFAGIKIDG